MEDLNLVIAGSAGEGIQTVGAVLSETVLSQGYAVFAWKEYESRIRGGQNSYSIRIGEKPCNAPLLEADILLCLNEGALAKYEPLLKDDGIVLAEEEVRERTIAVPFEKVAKGHLGNKVYANTIAVGAMIAILGMELDALKEVIGRRFSKKGDEVVGANYAAAEKGYAFAEKGCKGVCPWRLAKRQGSYYLVTGNQAIPSAAAYAGCRFISAYPMTPSTGIITFLATEEDRFGVFTE